MKSNTVKPKAKYNKKFGKSFANRLKTKSNRCIIYQTDILNSYTGGAYEKTTTKKAIAHHSIAPVSNHAMYPVWGMCRSLPEKRFGFWPNGRKGT